MSISNINSNLTDLVNQKYGADSSVNPTLNSLTNNHAQTLLSNESDSSNSSTVVRLGTNQNSPQTYNAQGIINQLQQYELSNDSLLFGTANKNTNDLPDLSSFSVNANSLNNTSQGNIGTSTTDSLSQQALTTALKNDPNGTLDLLESEQMSSISNLFESN